MINFEILKSFLKSISIEPIVFFYVLAIFAEYDVLGDLFYVNKCVDRLKVNNTEMLHKCTKDIKRHSSDIISKEISKAANNAQAIYNGILYFTSILSSFVAATYADRKSKFLPIIVPIIGSIIVQILILGSLFNNFTNELPFIFREKNGIYILFLCSFISGITGGTSTLLASCFAHVAEKCNKSQRTSRITIVEACLFGGGFFGFTIAGIILRRFPNSLNRYYWNFENFLLAHFLMALYVIIRRQMFHKPNSEQSRMTLKLFLTSVFRTINRQREYRYQRRIIYLILFSFILISYWTAALTTMLFIYTRHLLGWESWKYSYFSSAKFGLSGIFLCLLPVVQYILGNTYIQRLFNGPLKDGTIITIGLLSRAVSIILIGMTALLYVDSLMIGALLAIIFSEYPAPAIRSLISKIVEPNEKAQMFAVLAAIQSICFFTGGMGFLSIYNIIIMHVHNGPGWIFIIIGFIQLVSMFILWYVEFLIKQINMEQMSITRINNEFPSQE